MSDEQASYARSPVPVPAAGRGANLLDWGNEVRPKADVPVPPGHLAVKTANATHGATKPGQVLVLPLEQARALTRSGYAQEVLQRNPARGC